jgi:hypothetical protein
MNRLFLSCLLSASLALPVLASEPSTKPVTPEAPAPTPAPTHPATGTDTHKPGTPTPEQKDHPGHKDMTMGEHKEHHHKSKEERKAEQDAKKAEKMAEAAKKCKEDIAKAEELAKSAPEGEDKDMANYHIEIAKIEQKALENKNMVSHWRRHKNKCHRNVRKAEDFAKKHHHATHPTEHSVTTPAGTKPADQGATPKTGAKQPEKK